VKVVLSQNGNIVASLQSGFWISISDITERTVRAIAINMFDYNWDASKNALALSYNGDFLAIGTGRGKITYHGTDGLPKWHKKNHMKPIDAIAFSPKGDLLAVASSQFVGLWDTEKGKRRRLLDAHQSVHAMVFSPNGETLASASASADSPITLWSTKNEKKEVLCNTGEDLGTVFGMAFSPEGDLLASASKDKLVRLWDMTKEAKGNEPLIFKGHLGPVLAVAFSPKGDLMASASQDKSVRLWDPTTEGKELRILRGHPGPVRGLAFSQAGKTLISASLDPTCRLYTVDSVLERQPASAQRTEHSSDAIKTNVDEPYLRRDSQEAVSQGEGDVTWPLSMPDTAEQEEIRTQQEQIDRLEKENEVLKAQLKQYEQDLEELRLIA
jgi:WD40 repeat protein